MPHQKSKVGHRVKLYPLLAEAINQMLVFEYVYVEKIASVALKYEAFAKFAEFVVQRNEYSAAVEILEQYVEYLQRIWFLDLPD